MRVAVADDSALVREGIRLLLAEDGMECSVLAHDLDSVLAAVAADPPDVAVVDIRMPPTFTDEGLRAADEIRQRHGIPVIVLSQYREVSYALRLLRDGGGGYLLKDSITRGQELASAIRRVVAGETVVDQDLIGELVTHTPAHRRLEPLTPREREVLALVAQGHTDAAIAQQLWLTTRTVEAHIRNIQQKLGISELIGYNKRVRTVLQYLETH